MELVKDPQPKSTELDASPERTSGGTLEGLLSPSVSTILIKGAPGAGKSTLALELMRMSARGTYIMTRLSKEKLAIQNPHIKMIATGEEPTELSIDGAKLNATDDRLAGPKEVMRLVLDRMMNDHGGLIILDSWDSIAKEMDHLERLRSEKTMVTMIQASDSKLVFVSEGSDLTTTDFLVDAIVELKMSLHRSKLRRTCEVKKLRGQAIANPVTPYTLDDGRFEIFPPFRIVPAGEYKPSRYVPAPDAPGRRSSGIRDLDRLMGDDGFFPGMTVAVEYGKGIAAYALEPFMLTMAANFLSNGGSSVILPPSGESPDVILDLLRSILGKEPVNERARVGFYEKYEDPCTFQIHSRSIEETIGKFWETATKLRAGSKGASFLLLGIEKLEYIHGPQTILREVVPSVSRTSYNKDILALFTSSNCLTRDSIISVSDSHLLFEMWNGALMLQALKPLGPLMAVKYDYSKGFPQITLTPVR